MNRLLPIIAVLTVIATPAFAQSRVHQDAAQSSNNVYSYQGDRLIGTDPDPNVRASILKDYLPL